jgi:arylsulfatase A-like enzyme
MKNLNQYLIIPLLILLFSSCFKNKALKNSTNEKKPNVIFFLVDDLGWSDIGIYGSEFYETPNIDKLATEGVRFTDAYAAAHVCSPTRASILTGKYPASLNLTDWLPGRRDFPFQKLKNVEINQHLPYDVNTLPEMLKKNGYNTALIGKWHLGEEENSAFKQGFDFQLPKWNKGWPKEGYDFPYGMEGLEEGDNGEYLTDRMTDEAIKYIEQNKEKPFFLYLSHFAVHDPIEGRKDLVEKYAAKLAKTKLPSRNPFILEANPDEKNSKKRSELDSLLEDDEYNGYRIFSNESVKIKQHQNNVEFAGMVESMDESLGRIQNKLKELKLDENTIVIFYSDNGGMSAANFYYPDRKISKKKLDKAFATSNLPLRAGKGWMYEGGIRVPLIIKWPRKALQGAVSNVPVTSHDFFPTILEMVGIQTDNSVKNQTDGKSIATLLKGKKSLERDAIFWHFPHYSNHGNQSPGGAVRSGDYKLIEYYENGTIQLFNLVNDLSEQNDLSLKEPEKVKELKAMLHNWRAKVDAKMMLPNPDYDANAKIYDYKK